MPRGVGDSLWEVREEWGCRNTGWPCLPPGQPLWALLCCYLGRTFWRWSDILCFQSRKSDLCKQSPEALQTWRSLQEGEVKLYRRTIGGWPGPGQPWRRLPAKGMFSSQPPACRAELPVAQRSPKGQKRSSLHGVLLSDRGAQLQHTPRQHNPCPKARSNTFLQLLTWMLRQALHLPLRCKHDSDRECGQNSRLGFNTLLSMLHRRGT